MNELETLLLNAYRDNSGITEKEAAALLWTESQKSVRLRRILFDYWFGNHVRRVEVKKLANGHSVSVQFKRTEWSEQTKRDAADKRVKNKAAISRVAAKIASLDLMDHVLTCGKSVRNGVIDDLRTDVRKFGNVLRYCDEKKIPGNASISKTFTSTEFRNLALRNS